MRAEHRLEHATLLALKLEEGATSEGTQASDSMKEQGHDSSPELPERTSRVTV